jgi:hypothetical protein
MGDLISNATILIFVLLSISLHSLQRNKTSCANTSQISIFSVLILVLMSILHAYLGLYGQLFLSFHTIRLFFFYLLCLPILDPPQVQSLFQSLNLSWKKILTLAQIWDRLNAENWVLFDSYQR